MGVWNLCSNWLTNVRAYHRLQLNQNRIGRRISSFDGHVTLWTIGLMLKRSKTWSLAVVPTQERQTQD
jgi:hypothetical protein